ncbi:hypothetical protein IW262DRAFT_1466049 [Armillaria fumosa]|nr:hypothetical protein IW262DRAFT_1466049 [Armillaria fumosa]
MLSSTHPLEQEADITKAALHPARDSLNYYTASSGVKDLKTNTDTLPDTDRSSEGPTRPSTLGPSNHPYVTKLDEGIYVSGLQALRQVYEQDTLASPPAYSPNCLTWWRSREPRESMAT